MGQMNRGFRGHHWILVVNNHHHVIIHLIASPRNVSTALMYSIGQHDKIHVVDEPFYAAYLHRSGLVHPDRDLVLNSQSTERAEVFAQIRELEARYPVVFLKNMAHHMIEEDLDQMKTWKHVFLIRHPRLHIHSFTRVIPHPSLEALGTTTQRKWFDELSVRDISPHIIDANQLLGDPENILRRFCTAMDIEFQSAMLSWPAGPKSFDGCWGPHWYRSVWKSTEFGAPKSPESIELPEYLLPLYTACMADYQYLYEQIKG